MLLSLFIPAVPPMVDAPIAPPAIVVAQAATTAGKPDVALGNCESVQTPDSPTGQVGGGLYPAATVKSYWNMLSVQDAKVTVLEGPKHGVVKGSSRITENGPPYGYVPDHGFLGEDRITFLVEVAGKRVKVVMTLFVVENSVDQGDSPCPGYIQFLNSIEAPRIATDLTTWLSATQHGGQFADNFMFNFAALTGGAVGQTAGTNITLDTNAAVNSAAVNRGQTTFSASVTPP